MASQELQTLIAAKRANPYSAGKTLAELRGDADARAATPLPEGTTHIAADANGVPGEWVDAPGSAPDRVFLFLHGGACSCTDYLKTTKNRPKFVRPACMLATISI